MHQSLPQHTGGFFASTLRRRQLTSYPDTRARMRYLAVAVIACVALHYESYVIGGVTPLLLSYFKTSLSYYISVRVAAGVVGAFLSLFAGLTDRWGRGNLIVYGMGVTALLTLLTPMAPNRAAFFIVVGAASVIEGILVLATMSLVRDFSPQVGRATSMGFWCLGPVLGSFIVSTMATTTLPILRTWQSQYYICGAIGALCFLFALFCLRELPPSIRDQVIVSAADQKLIEAQAEEATRQVDVSHPWRQMARADIIAPAFAMSLFLIVYVTLVSFFTLFLTTNYGFSTATATGITAWAWVAGTFALVIAGAVSDRLRVRKPFMLGGALLVVAMTYALLTKTDDPNTSTASLSVIVILLNIGYSTAYVPWLASFTETIERRNPALTATGLSIFGWTERLTISFSVFVLPYVVTTSSVLVDAPSVLAEAKKLPEGTEPPPDLAERLAQVNEAMAIGPGQWQSWWWFCIVAELSLIPSILLMAGRWRPRTARADLEAHKQEVARLTKSATVDTHDKAGTMDSKADR